jgi:hypothetical protein
MEKHQRNASANGKILAYLSQMYLYPRDLKTLIYASQLLQAQAMQYGVEHWRRHRGRFHCAPTSFGIGQCRLQSQWADHCARNSSHRNGSRNGDAGRESSRDICRDSRRQGGRARHS